MGGGARIGSVRFHANDWIYHSDLGWAYAVEISRKVFDYGQEKEVGFGR